MKWLMVLCWMDLTALVLLALATGDIAFIRAEVVCWMAITAGTAHRIVTSRP